MAGEMKIRITADASQATTTMKATQANINKITKDLPSLEKAYNADRSQDNLDKINSKLSNVIELINRAAKAIAMTDSTTTEAEVKSKLYAATIESLGREYKGLTSESLNYLKGLKENISIEEENIRLIQEKTRAQEQYNNSLKSIIRTNVTGSGEYNAMGLAYNIPETYAETYSKLLEEKDMQEKQALLDDWLAAKKEHEAAITNVEKIAQEERFNQYKQSLKEKEAKDKAYYKSIEEEIKATEEREKKEAEYSKSVNESLDKAKEMAEAQNNIATATKAVGTAAKTSSNYFLKLFDTTKNILMFRVIMNVVNSLAKLNDFMGDSVQAAAEAEQIYSKLNTTFGKTSQAMSKAISLASKLGVATSTAASALSTVGDLLQAQGQITSESLSTAYEWVSQFQDIIAFKDINMSLEEFAQNFMSGAAGNLRNFRTFGSIVRESAVNAELAKRGLDKLTGSELELAKMTVRAEMALEQQKNAMGAAQREWDSMLSIQRRYEEAVKQFQENIGDSLNPVVKMWTELKTAMLEVFTAQETWNKKQKMVEEKKAIDTKYVTFDENGEIVNQSNYLGLTSYIDAANTAYVNASSEERMQEALNNLMISIQEYGVTVSDLTRTMADMRKNGMAIDFNFWIQAVEYASDYLTELENIKKEEEELENLLTKANQIDSLFEQMQTIEGIDLTDNADYNDFIKALDSANENGISDKTAFEELVKIVPEYVLLSATGDVDRSSLSLTEKAFSSDPYLDLLEKKRDAYKELYVLAANSGKYEEEAIEYIIGLWEDANKEIDAYNEKTSKIAELEVGTANYKKQLEQLGMSDFEKTIDDFERMLEGITDKDIVDAITKQKEAFIELTEATEAQKKAQAWEALGENFSSSFGEFETLVTMWGSLGDVTGGLGSLLGILVDIVAQTEVVTRLGSILTDSILPVLNAFLEPLLPVIDMVSQSISLLVESVLVPFYPILQGLSSILVVVFGLLNAGINYFVDGVKMLAGKVVEGIQSMINGIIDLINNIPFVDIGHVSFKASEWADIDPDDNLKKNMQIMEEQLNRIARYTMETAENTESDDYETYRRLLQAKEITSEQYARLTHQDVYTTKTVGNGIEYTSGGKKSYVSINSLTVQVPTGMTLEEFLKNLGDYSNGNLPFGVNTISA